MSVSPSRIVVGVSLFLALFASSCLAQTTGTLRGTVTDPSGAIVPQAKVTVLQEGTGVTRTVRSSEQGSFEFAALSVGLYTLRVEREGFHKYERQGINITIGHFVIADAVLELGTQREATAVSGAPPLVETVNTQLGAVVNERAVTSLPLNQRDTYQLLQLQPGVVAPVAFNLYYGSDQPGAVSVNGGRGRANYFMVNGGDGNDLFINAAGVQPSPDTIQEFRVLTNTFDAEYGRNSGSIVNVITKSGSNDYHGSAYEFFRNKVLNARGFFDTTKPDFKQNQFGGTFGGPIRKDRTFFFASYEGRRIRQGISSDLVTVPTTAERQGDFSAGPAFHGTLTDANVAAILNARPGCASAVSAAGGAPIAAGTAYSAIFKGNQVPTACFDPTANDLLQQFVPPANVAGAPNEFETVVTQQNRADQFSGRVDEIFSEKHRLAVYYYFNDGNLKQPFSTYQASGANLPGFGGNTAIRNQQVNLAYTWTLNATTINEARFTYYREGESQLNAPQRTNLVQDSCKTVPASECFSDPNNPSLGLTPGIPANLGGVPYTTLGGEFTFGNNIQGQAPQAGNTFQWADGFSKIIGKHSLKLGGEIRREQFNQLALFGTTGGFYFFGGGPNDPGYSDVVPNYLLGLADQFVQGSPTNQYLRRNSFYLYAQDSWRLRANLTLNYGLRWELAEPFNDRYNRIENFIPGFISPSYPCQLAAGNPLVALVGSTNCDPGGPGESVFPVGLAFPGDKGVPKGLSYNYYKAFGPRIGLAWSPFGSPKTSVRAGFGMFYNPVEQLVYKQFNGAPPFGAAPFLTNILYNTPYQHQDGTTAVNPFPLFNQPPAGQPVDWSIFRPTSLFGQQNPHRRPEEAQQYNLTIQHQFAHDLVLQVGYVGSEGHFLAINHDLNPGNAQTCLDLAAVSAFYAPAAPGAPPNPNANKALSIAYACGPFFADSPYSLPARSIPAGFTLHLPYGSVPSVTGPNPQPITLVGLRQYSSPLCQPTTGVGCPPDGHPVFGSIYTADNAGNSNYNSFQVSVEKRAAKGLDFLAAYTFSKSFDYASTFEDTVNPFDFRRSYALSQFDARHRFVVSYIWQLPAPAYQGWTGKLLNGWSVSGITSIQSGTPIRITSNADIELQNSFAFLTAGEPDQIVPSFHTGSPRQSGCAPGTAGPKCPIVPNQFFDPNQFSNATVPLGSIGNSARTVCCGPGINNFDFSLLKDTGITERSQLQFRAEFFNAFNHAQFQNPDGNISDGNTFGQVVRARDPRLVQFALKLLF